MKKLILIITSTLLLVLILGYTLLFTTTGNNLLKPVIENKINQSAPLPLKLSEFFLDTSHLRVSLKLDEQNIVLLEGEYSLFSLDFDFNYDIRLTKLSNLNKLAQRELSGKLLSKGTVNGDINLFKIKGKSDLAQSQTDYAIVIREMQLDKAAIKLTDAHIQELLAMVGEKPYANGKINLHVQLNDLNPQHMIGSVVLAITQASLDAKTLKKELGLDLHKTALQGEFKASLEGAEINYLANLSSEIISLHSKGKIETQDSALESSYQIDIQELALLKELTHSVLRGSLSTQGKVSGEKNSYKIEGESNIADSKTHYSLSLLQMKPAKLILSIKDARLERILYMAGKEKFAKAKLNADIQLNSLDPSALDGSLRLRMSEGEIDNALMQKVFQVTLPKGHFTLDTITDLTPDNIGYSLNLRSNLAMITSKGDINPKTLQTKADYQINIKELALLKPLTALPFRGPFETSGTLQGDKQEFLVKGKSSLAQSKTDYNIRLEEFVTKQVKLDIKKAELSKLLYLAGEPSYAQGEMDLKIDLDALSPLDGKINLIITKGLFNKDVIKDSFDKQLPDTRFKLKCDADIKEDRLNATTAFDSNLAQVNMKKIKLDLKTNAFISDYDLLIPSLEKLEPVLERKLYGEIKINGEISKDKQLSITAHSKVFQGQVDAKILDDKITSDFKDLHALDVLQMLGYPQIMDTPVNGTLVYDKKTEQGKLNARFDKAVLTRSKMTDLIRGLSGTDLSKEHFNQGSLISLIDKEIITSDLNMESKDASLKSKKFIINSKKQLIDGRFSIKVKKDSGDVLVKGDINSPSVRLDAKSMVTPELKEKVGKEINRFLKKLF